MKISRATLSNYIKILVDAKILYECSRFDMKSKKSLSGEKKYYVSDLSFYFSLNTDNKINYGPVLENIVYFYAKSQGYSISVGRIGKLEYKSLESIRDNYPKYVMTTDYLLQNRNGIKHVNLIDFIISNSKF